MPINPIKISIERIAFRSEVIFNWCHRQMKMPKRKRERENQVARKSHKTDCSGQFSRKTFCSFRMSHIARKSFIHREVRTTDRKCMNERRWHVALKAALISSPSIKSFVTSLCNPTKKLEQKFVIHWNCCLIIEAETDTATLNDVDCKLSSEKFSHSQTHTSSCSFGDSPRWWQKACK